MRRTVHVYGHTELAEAVTGGLQEWGHTVERVSDPVHVGEATDTLWLAADMPVTSAGIASVETIMSAARTMAGRLRGGALMLISTQLPVGSLASLEKLRPDVDFACVPEYFRRVDAATGFRDPMVIVLGVREHVRKQRIVSLYHQSLRDRMLWMSPESAEMSKHAVNSFLATTITFANEMARLCEGVGADYADVEYVLRLDPRIGERAYVASGAADGTHLLRDLRYLRGSRLFDLIIELWQSDEGV